MSSIIELMHREVKDDCYSTPKCALEDIRDYIPPVRIWDPFWCDGNAKKYMEEVFPDAVILHKNEDAFTAVVDDDMILTNPPFSKKYEVLEWLMKRGKPFVCLVPIWTIASVSFRRIDGYEDFQFLIPRRRINFEKNGEVLPKGAYFESIWLCYGMGLGRDVNFV